VPAAFVCAHSRCHGEQRPHGLTSWYVRRASRLARSMPARWRPVSGPCGAGPAGPLACVRAPLSSSHPSGVPILTAL
jgi:hypothetical protein